MPELDYDESNTQDKYEIYVKLYTEKLWRAVNKYIIAKWRPQEELKVQESINQLMQYRGNLFFFNCSHQDNDGREVESRRQLADGAVLDVQVTDDLARTMQAKSKNSALEFKEGAAAYTRKFTIDAASVGKKVS